MVLRREVGKRKGKSSRNEGNGSLYVSSRVEGMWR